MRSQSVRAPYAALMCAADMSEQPESSQEAAAAERGERDSEGEVSTPVV